MTVPQLHVGAGTTLGPLTLFPVWTDAPGELGISTGTRTTIEVSELASGPQVGKLTVTNRGPRPALLLEGELLEGGHQHRVSARDVILGAGESRDIETYCVEQGRWGGDTGHGRSARRAPMNVRAELHRAEPGTGQGNNRQGRIWERVSRFQGMNASSATGSLVDHLNASAARPVLTTDALPSPIEGQRGIIAGLGGQALMLEVFGTHTLFLRHYRQLVEAAVMDIQLLGRSLPHTATPGQAARDLAARVMSATLPPFGQDRVTVRNHGTLSSQPLLFQTPDQALSGVSIVLPKRGPVIAHLSAWNTRHPVMAGA
ncbi:DUF6569 family protein [Arthrobacter sp. 2YAF22_2]|uniref:ARPP-1 family domain-containing protein n=1 Tax=Arthrobacter sp. 2YAF22_2 TaxID=3233029 RepID=UPI003F91ABF2